jgi:aldose 1-epimerase
MRWITPLTLLYALSTVVLGAAIEKDNFGKTADGTTVERYTLTGAGGMTVKIISYGATVTELLVPDRRRRVDDVVLGFDNLRQYETESPYFGCTAGRVAFRITNAEFVLNGKTYRLTRNSEQHHLHGGTRGLSKVVWRAEPLAEPKAPGVRFRYRSPDGDQGYPGNLDVAVVYTVTPQNELKIDYTASADQDTPVNLTHHSYFNLAGAGSGDVRGHVLHLDADRYTPMTPAAIPTGKIASVKGTPYDFTRGKTIGAEIDKVGGYDLSYLRSAAGRTLARVALLTEPVSGRRMEVLSTSPALVLYTGNYLDGSLRGKGEAVYPKHAGLCLETGYLPDSMHQPTFPSIILPMGKTYRETCIYRFSAGEGRGERPQP